MRLIRLLAASTFLVMGATAAMAEIAPACPGGGTATGTFHCTGPVFWPTCTEGPPWKCPITTSDSVMTMDGIDTPRPPRFGQHVLPPAASLSESSSDGGGAPMPTIIY
jgi:hypothetical protein